MRAKRAKQYKKAMNLYQMYFGFREPYQIITDGNFLDQITQNLETCLESIFQGKVKPMSTYCIRNEIKLMGEEYKPLYQSSRQLEKRRCTHQDPIIPRDCILSIIGENNPFHYCVATQDESLRNKLREIKGVPIVHIKKGVIILEPPSQITLNHVKEIDCLKIQPKSFEISLNKTKKPFFKKKFKGKEPNPLSCKKKSVKIE